MSEIPDAITAAPEVHATLLENRTFRILNVRVPPGTKTALHAHPENATYVLKGGALKFTMPDGSVKEVTLTAGQALASAANAHIVENIGTEEIHVIQVELKR